MLTKDLKASLFPKLSTILIFGVLIISPILIIQLLLKGLFKLRPIFK